jgi:hypothetical protein
MPKLTMDIKRIWAMELNRNYIKELSHFIILRILLVKEVNR